MAVIIKVIDEFLLYTSFIIGTGEPKEKRARTPLARTKCVYSVVKEQK